MKRMNKVVLGRKKSRSQRLLVEKALPVESKQFSMTFSFQRVNSPISRDEPVILPDVNYMLSGEEEVEEMPRQKKEGPRRSRSFHQETFSVRKEKILPPSIYVNPEGWQKPGRPPLPNKEQACDLVTAKRELKKIECESKETMEQERCEFQRLFNETVERHKMELNDSESEPDKVLELTRYDSGTVRAVPVSPTHTCANDNPEARKQRREMIERHKTEIIKLNEDFTNKMEVIKMEYERRMKPWQDRIFQLMSNDENSVELYSGPLTPDSRHGVSPFGVFIQRRPSDGAISTTRRFPLLKIIEK